MSVTRCARDIQRHGRKFGSTYEFTGSEWQWWYLFYLVLTWWDLVNNYGGAHTPACFSSSIWNLIRSIRFRDKHGISHEFYLILVACLEKIKARCLYSLLLKTLARSSPVWAIKLLSSDEAGNKNLTSRAHKYSDGRDQSNPKYICSKRYWLCK